MGWQGQEETGERMDERFLSYLGGGLVGREPLEITGSSPAQGSSSFSDLL